MRATQNLKSQLSNLKLDSAHCARSFGYGLIAEAFRWPSAELVREWRDPTRWEKRPDVVKRLYPETAEYLTELQQRIFSPQPLGELEADYISLFGHTVRGSCPLYELEYGQSEIIQQASFLADIGGFYTAFGLIATTDGQERLDHLCVEAEFMSILVAQEAHAAAIADFQGREIIRRAQSAFLNDHLGRWLPAAMRRVREAAPKSFYGMMAAFTQCFVAAECLALDVKIGPELLDLRNVEATVDAAIQCGVEESCPGSGDDELIQIQLDPSLSPGS